MQCFVPIAHSLGCTFSVMMEIRNHKSRTILNKSKPIREVYYSVQRALKNRKDPEQGCRRWGSIPREQHEQGRDIGKVLAMH